MCAHFAGVWGEIARFFGPVRLVSASECGDDGGVVMMVL